MQNDYSANPAQTAGSFKAYLFGIITGLCIYALFDYGVIKISFDANAFDKVAVSK
jgi:tetrahydromethanopterin S-methyltransferase subunit B